MHEMGEMKRSQELFFHAEVDRKTWKTIQRLTSQVQELQERINYLNDSGEFHEVESNYYGKFSHVPSQPISAELRQMLATWNMESIWTIRKLFCKPTLDAWLITKTLSRNSSIYDTMCRRWGSRAHQHRETCGKREWKNRKHNSQCRHLQEGRRLWAPSFLWIFHGVPWLGNKDGRYRNFNLTNSCLLSFLRWKIRFRNQATACSDFPSEAMLWIKEVEMVSSMEKFQLRARIFRILNCWTRGLSLLWTSSSKTPTSRRKSVSSNRKSGKEDRFQRYWCSWYSSWLRCFFLYHSSRW